MQFKEEGKKLFYFKQINCYFANQFYCSFKRPHMEDNFSFKFDTLNGECLLNGRKLENLRQSNVLNQTHNFEIVAVYDGHGGTVSCFEKFL